MIPRASIILLPDGRHQLRSTRCYYRPMVDPNRFVIITPRLRLAAATAEHLAAELDDHAGLSRHLGAAIPEEWPPPLTLDAIPLWVEAAGADPTSRGWFSWYWIARDMPDGETLIGGGGFFGPPAEDRTVVIGYSVLERFQRRGYAREGVTSLVAWAFDDRRVERVIAHTDSTNIASILVLERNMFSCVGPGTEIGSLRFERLKDGRSPCGGSNRSCDR